VPHDPMVSQARRKMAKKQPLSAEEQAAYRAYWEDKNNRQWMVYWPSVEVLQQHQALAKQQGFGKFGQWCYKQIESSVKGILIDPVVIEELKVQVQRYKKQADEEREHAEEYRLEAKQWSMKYQQVADSLASLAAKVGQAKGAKK